MRAPLSPRGETQAVNVTAAVGYTSACRVGSQALSDMDVLYGT